jgi:hypothetical protein
MGRTISVLKSKIMSLSSKTEDIQMEEIAGSTEGQGAISSSLTLEEFFLRLSKEIEQGNPKKLRIFFRMPTSRQ